jgi:tRNA threonylcarbamoyladenosine biosynthesis protein TsaB
VHSEALHTQYANQVMSTLPEMTPMAEAILTLATPVFERGQALPASEAKPVYIRNRVALTSKEREQGLRL